MLKTFKGPYNHFNIQWHDLFDYYGNAYKNSVIGGQTQNIRSSLSSTSFLGDREEQNAYHIVKRRREEASLVTSGGLSKLQRYLNQHLLILPEIDEEGSFDLLGWCKSAKQIKVSISYFPLWLVKYYKFMFPL